MHSIYFFYVIVRFHAVSQGRGEEEKRRRGLCRWALPAWTTCCPNKEKVLVNKVIIHKYEG